MKRVRISNDSLNDYGSRVLTKGMNVAQYQRNPVLLYMHERGNVIGYVKDVKVENDEVTGELVFDEVTELSKRCKKQFEFGSIRMVSAGIDILELSEKPDVLLQGQTCPTVTKSKLFEVSLVDVGANDDAIVMRKDGEQVTLGKDGTNPLPVLSKKNEDKPQKKKMEMETKTLALQLGLPETATEVEVKAKLAKLTALEKENENLRKEAETLKLAGITSLVEKAVGEKRITADRKDQFVTLGKTIGAEELEKVFSAMSPQVKLSGMLHNGGDNKPQQTEYKKLSDVPSDKLLTLRKDEPETYKRLYKAEYGMECEI